MFTLGLIAIFGLSVAGNGKEPPSKTGGPHYYSSFKTKTLPEVPTGEISESDAKANAMRAAYYVAYFDGGGRLIRLEKYLRGVLDWKSEYTYDDRGKVREGTRIDTNGKRTVYQFHSSGKVARKSELKLEKH
jgi:hypothetical protein